MPDHPHISQKQYQSWFTQRDFEYLYFEIWAQTHKNTAFVPSDKVRDVVYDVYQTLQTPSLYHAKLLAHHYKWLDYVSESDKLQVEKIVSTHHFEDIRSQVEEVMVRYNENARIASKVLQISKKSNITDRHYW